MGIDLNDYEEISQEEWGNLDYRESAMYNIGGKEKFFKKKSKNVFEDEISSFVLSYNCLGYCLYTWIDALEDNKTNESVGGNDEK